MGAVVLLEHRFSRGYVMTKGDWQDAWNKTEDGTVESRALDMLDDAMAVIEALDKNPNIDIGPDGQVLLAQWNTDR